MNLFKGYVPTEKKKCLMKFKNADSSELKTLDEVRNLSEYAGILNNDVILIDVDDYDQSEIMMNIVEDKELVCRVYQTTRGKHFLFINVDENGLLLQETCKIKTLLCCGITADIKVGCKNSYSILKYDNVERKIIYDKYDDEEYQILPKYFLPVNQKVSFFNMENGDGRNQSLFNYILTLQSRGLNVDEIKDCIHIINDYIFKDPLDESEIETIIRDDAFKKPVFFSNTGKFYFDKFAEYIRRENHIIKINGQLHIFYDGIYTSNFKLIENSMIKQIKGLNKAKRNEVLSYLDIMIDQNNRVDDAALIAFKNGVLNINTGDIYDFSPEYIITNKIEFNYNPDAYSKIADITLNKLACNDIEIRSLLEELIGYTFYRRNELRKAFILVGDKSNGKSTYLDMIKNLLGDENTSALDLKELGDRFKTAELFGKLANIGDDIGDEFIPNPAIFKKLTSGDRLNAERKGQDPFDFNSYAKLLFSANTIPRIKDKSGAVMSRLVIIPFKAEFSDKDEDFDPNIKYKLRTDSTMEYLIRLGIEGLKRVLEKNHFTISKKVEKEIDEYEHANNPILSFFETIEKIENEPTSVIYRKYVEFCVSNNFSPMSNIEFSRQIKKYFGLNIINKTINGKKYRVFVEEEETI